MARRSALTSRTVGLEGRNSVQLRGTTFQFPVNLKAVFMKKTLLHVGCGPLNKSHLIGFNTDEWQEIRFDIDENVRPDIVGTLIDMHQIADDSVDAVYSSHNIEHLYAHEVIIALKEFRRVLKPDGLAVITCPDLQSVCEAVVNDKLTTPLYDSPAGPITPFDILYGHREFIKAGNHYMAHKCGFTYSALHSTMIEAGFKATCGMRLPESFDLWLVGFKNERDEASLVEMASEFLPSDA